MKHEELASILSALFGDDERIAAAYLIGSRAADRARPDSDLDIAVLPAKGLALSAMDRVGLGTKIALATGLETDLGILTSKNLVYARETVMKGQRLYSRDPRFASYMEMIFLSMYDRYDQDRKELLDALRA